MSNPISSVIQDGVPVSKSAMRGYENSRNPVIMGNADEVRSRTLTSLFLIYVLALEGFFRRDTSDTTSVDDGLSVIVDAAGNRWKRVLTQSMAFDAYGSTEESPSDRDQYDDEDEGFTFWDTAAFDGDGGWYVRFGAAGNWLGPFRLGVEGPKGDPGDTGPQGLTGDTGPQGAAGIGIVPQGAWDAGTTYAADDGVTYQGSYWRSLQSANTGNDPAVSPLWWEETVAKGDTGPAGPATSVDRSVRMATTGNITLSGEQTIDGVAVASGDQVLVKNQSAPEENGVYVVASGAWSRDGDYDTWDELVGALVGVEEGDTQADSIWMCTADAGGTLGTTAVTWAQRYGSATESVEGLVELASTAEASAGVDTSRAVTPAGLADRLQTGLHTIWMTAAGMTPRASNGAEMTTRDIGSNITLPVMRFEGGALSIVIFTVAMPPSWDGGALKYQVVWTAGAGAGDTLWQLRAAAFADDAAMPGTWGSAVAVTDTFLASNDLHISAVSGEMTPSGGGSGGDMLVFDLRRFGTDGGDTKSEAVDLIGVRLYYGVAAVNDA